MNLHRHRISDYTAYWWFAGRQWFREGGLLFAVHIDFEFLTAACIDVDVQVDIDGLVLVLLDGSPGCDPWGMALCHWD